MEKKTISLPLVAEVAKGLGELRDQVVFVGGAILGLYADSLGHVTEGEELRITTDIDLTVSILNYGGWTNFQEKLSTRKFYPDSSSDVICRYKFGPIQVDIMPAQDIGIGESNRWYQLGLENLQFRSV